MTPRAWFYPTLSWPGFLAMALVSWAVFSIGSCVFFPPPHLIWRNVRTECVILERYSDGSEVRLPAPTTPDGGC